MSRDHSFIFEIAPKNCISDSFVDYDGSSITFKRFLPTVVDIMALGVSSIQAPVYKAVIVIIIVVIEAPPFKAFVRKRSAAREAAKGVKA